MLHVSSRLAVSKARLALADLYNVAIRIANVAARLAVLFLWLCDERGSSTTPQFIARLNICDADIRDGRPLSLRETPSSDRAFQSGSNSRRAD